MRRCCYSVVVDVVGVVGVVVVAVVDVALLSSFAVKDGVLLLCIPKLNVGLRNNCLLYVHSFLLFELPELLPTNAVCCICDTGHVSVLSFFAGPLLMNFGHFHSRLSDH